MVKMLNPNALVPSADTVKNDIMKTFEEEQKKMKKLFQVILNICIYILFKYLI